MQGFVRVRVGAVAWLVMVATVAGACGSTPATPAPASAAPPAASAPVDSTATTEATPAEPVPPTATPAPTATVAATPAPTPKPTIADIIDAPAAAVAAADVKLHSEHVSRYFSGGCANTWKRLTAAEAKADREVACLSVIGTLYAGYVASGKSSEMAFGETLAAYQYAVGQLGASGKAYLDAGLRDLDTALAATPPAPTGLKKLSALAKVPYRATKASAIRKAIHDALPTDLGTLLAACQGFDWPGAGWDACLPYALYPPEKDRDGNAPLAKNRVVTAVAGCQYSGRVGNVRPDATVHNCGLAGTPFWMAYLATGKAVYWNALVGIRDLLWAKGDGRYANMDMKDFTGCYSSWVLAPGTQSSCSD